MTNVHSMLLEIGRLLEISSKERNIHIGNPCQQRKQKASPPLVGWKCLGWVWGRGPLPQSQHPRGPSRLAAFPHPRSQIGHGLSSCTHEMPPWPPAVARTLNSTPHATHSCQPCACVPCRLLLMLWHAWLWQEPQTFSSFVCQRRTRHTAADSSNTLCSLPASMPRQRAGKPGDSTVFISSSLHRFHLRFPFPTIHRPARPVLKPNFHPRSKRRRRNRSR